MLASALQSPVILRNILVSLVEIQKATLGFGTSLTKLPLKPFWGAVHCLGQWTQGTRQVPVEGLCSGLEWRGET